jgi:hypothetical protein
LPKTHFSIRLFGSGGDYEGVGGNSIVVADAIYEECSFLRRGFSNVKFDHCPREANNVAHILACNSERSFAHSSGIGSSRFYFGAISG